MVCGMLYMATGNDDPNDPTFVRQGSTTGATQAKQKWRDDPIVEYPRLVPPQTYMYVVDWKLVGEISGAGFLAIVITAFLWFMVRSRKRTAERIRGVAQSVRSAFPLGVNATIMISTVMICLTAAWIGYRFRPSPYQFERIRWGERECFFRANRETGECEMVFPKQK
jgi:hypothetical protein